MNVFSVPPDAPFLPTLVEALLDGKLVQGFAPRGNPLLLSTATIYLPTRRAARALSAAFIDASNGKAAILPAIRTLGDGDDDEFDAFTLMGMGAMEQTGPSRPPMGDLERKLQLATLVRGWTTAMAQATRELFGDEDIAIPSSAPDAIRMAADLARLMDSMATEEIGWEALKTLAGGDDERPENWAQWWNLTLHFLSIATTNWPLLLDALGKSDPAVERRRLLDLRTRRLLEAGSKGPVIAAGSTGSIPATARFLAAIARQSNGAVVLPGLDFGLENDVWDLVGSADAHDESLALCTHPQHGLARLLKAMGCQRPDVTQIGDQSNAARALLVSLAMLPASETGRWQEAGKFDVQALDHMALIEAPNDRQEALAIAIALREVLETPDKTAALVTPDRLLAARVGSELSRFGIEIDDSGGQPVLQSEPVVLARLALATATCPADPVTLAAFLKHRLVVGSGRMGRLFELCALRDAIIVPRAGELGQTAISARRMWEGNKRALAEVKAMLPQDWEALAIFGERMDAALRPLTMLRDAGEGVETRLMLMALAQTLALLFEGPELERFHARPGGSALQTLFERAMALPDAELKVLPEEFCDVLDAVLAGETMRDNRRHHPRLAILGPLEARMQPFDRIILGGLNEGVWPAQARNDAFLNRPMKAEIGLSTPERRIGQAAHDFQQFCGAPEAILSRSLRSGNAPTVASRFVQRLMVLAGDSASKARASGKHYVELAQTLDRSAKKAQRVSRPNPKPAVSLRPVRLSVTEIERWIRDPYAIHAKHILGIKPLPPLERSADPSLRGQIYHAILAEFVRTTNGARADMQVMERVARQEFERNNLPTEIVAIWLPRFLSIAALFVDWENERSAEVFASHCELNGKTVVGDTGFMLSGTADRIDILNDNSLSIIDYKTGSKPSAQQARTLSPQLALEAAMAKRGAFDIGAARTSSQLLYVRLRRGETLKVDDVVEKKPGAPDADGLAERAFNELTRLIRAYRNPEKGYQSRFAPMLEADISGEYDHLARVREWSTGDDEQGEGGDG